MLGALPKLATDPIGYFMARAREQGDVSRFRLAHVPAYLINSPQGVRHVLQENAKNYDRQTPAHASLRLFFGNGLIVSDGTFWLRQRRLAQPAFHKERIAKLTERMTQAALEVADAWEIAATRGQSVDVAREMMRLTMRIAGETLLSSDVTADADSVGEAVYAVLANASSRFNTYQPPLWVPTSKNRRFNADLRKVDELIFRVIAERRALPPGASPHDLLTMLMEATDEDTGERMSDAQLRDELVTMFVAGHETLANNLAWTFYLLSKFPSVRRELVRELDAVVGGGPVRLEHTSKLAYTKRVLSESLRLYPPGWVLGRRAIREDVVDGYRVDANSVIFICPYALHRHPRVWENPEGFDPDRFLPEREAGRHRFSFIPFGGGPHICIGNAFAMLAAQIAVGTLCQRFQLDLVPGVAVEPEPLVTLCPRGGIEMSVHRTAPRSRGASAISA